MCCVPGYSSSLLHAASSVLRSPTKVASPEIVRVQFVLKVGEHRDEPWCFQTPRCQIVPAESPFRKLKFHLNISGSTPTSNHSRKGPSCGQMMTWSHDGSLHQRNKEFSIVHEVVSTATNYTKTQREGSILAGGRLYVFNYTLPSSY